MKINLFISKIIKKLLQKNINSLKAMAEKNGITVAELLKMFKSE